MGVPAFFKWLLEKYPKTVQDMLERRQSVVDGVAIPLDLNAANPNGVEYDNLYVDMNGLIHPCSHPEDREAPSTEFEMYVNVTKYVDRLFAAVRPRRLLFLAIDGVAPRAKMNQQRSRRFRAAQDAKERAEALQEVIEEMRIMGLSPPDSRGPEWDSNVITPGTDFMSGLSTYLRFYILDRMNRDPAWKNIEVILSDASVPGEGEHKVMSFIRHQRSQPGYDPNQRHVLHGLDADLIMLALATHEAHFTILREEVTFGRGKHNVKSDGQRMLDEMNRLEGGAISALHPEDEWVYGKPLQRLDVAVLREYLSGEFSALSVEGLLPFRFDLERVIDDFVFLCFFVGNDFLPHLPSLDIRDGALDFLMESYKDLLPSMGDYITSPGGAVNLRQVDIILGRVGEVEDIVFQRKKAREDQENQKRARNNARRKGGGYDKHSGDTLLDSIRSNTVSANSSFANRDLDKIALVPLGAAAPPPPPPPSQAYGAQSNVSAAQALRARMGAGAGAPPAAEPTEGEEPPAQVKLGKRDSSDMSLSGMDGDEAEAELDNPQKVQKQEPGDAAMQPATAVMSEADLLGAPEMEADSDEGDLGDDMVVVASAEEEDAIKRRSLVQHYRQFMHGDAAKEAQDIVKARLKTKQNEMLEKQKSTVQDKIKLHESGWKDRYYGDKYKKEDLEKGGGLQEMCHHYIKGLLWVFKYYYEGCVSWSWFYPFHYAPFASDLVNVDSYVIEFELAEPFHPFEQLLSVLPSESAHCLPEACSWLMTDADSPIVDIYDSDIPIDPNGKPLPWLWVLLIPFIDENRVREAMAKCAENLSPEEVKRNTWGPMLMFLHKDNSLAVQTLSCLDYSAMTDAPSNLTGDEVIDAALKGPSQAVEEAPEAEDGVSPGDSAQELQAKSDSEFKFGCDAGNGICGTLVNPPPEWYSPLDAVISAPSRPVGVCTDIERNVILSFVYRGPPVKQHLSRLLDGVRPDASILSPQDLIPRKQRIGRGQVDILQISQATRTQEARGFGTDPQALGHGGRVEYDQYGRARPAGAGLNANSSFFQGPPQGRGYEDRRGGDGRGDPYRSGRGYDAGYTDRSYGGDRGYTDRGYGQPYPDRGGYDDRPRGHPAADYSQYSQYSGGSYPPQAGGAFDRGGFSQRPPGPPMGGYSGYPHSGYDDPGRHGPPGGMGYRSQGPPPQMGYPPGGQYPPSGRYDAPPPRGYDAYDRGRGSGPAPAPFSHSSNLGPRPTGGGYAQSSAPRRAPMEYSGSRNQQSYGGGARPPQADRAAATAGLSTFSARNTSDISAGSLAAGAAALRGAAASVPPAPAPPPRPARPPPRDPRLRK